MCFDSDSRPPVPRIRGAAVSHEELVLESADGTRFAAFLALPDEPPRVGLVVLPDVRGLYRFYEELALRLAERGHAAVAIDYFGRTAGVGARGDDFDWQEHVARLDPVATQADVRAAVELVRSRGCGSVFTLGFCFGGRTSWLAAAAGHGLAGAIGFYGTTTRHERFAGDGPTEVAERMEAPILALQAGADPGITPAQNEAFEQALREAGVEHELVVYEGAPHSFFDRKQDEFRAASDDAWRRVLAFVERHA